MTRTARSTIAAIGCALVLTASADPRVQAAAPGRASIGLQQYGQVTLRDLPAGARRPGTRQGLSFRPTDPDGFRRHKSSPQLAEAPGVSTTAGSQTLAVTETGFDGVSFADAGALPPDTQIAVGPNHIFEAVNDWVRIWSRQTSPPSVAYDVDLGTFFGVGFFTTLTDVVSDPRVIYDAASGRWFVSCVTLESFLNTADWRLAVSKTSDPAGEYKLYAASFSGSLPDFPSLGLSDDKLALTGNAFTMATEQFLGSEFLVANKADLVAGSSSPGSTFFGPPQALDTIQAAQSLSSSSTLYLAAVPADGQSSTLQIWSITGVPGIGTGVSVTTSALTQQTTLVVPPDAVQPNSSIAIATNDARLLNLVYRDGSLWMGSTTGCMPAGDTSMRACLHFAQVDTSAQAITQEMTFGEAGIDYYYPAVALDASDNLVTMFNRSSSSEYVSIYTSGHNAGDPAGSFQAPALVHSGQAAYDPTPYAPRWGDYSGISVDPLDGNASVWVAGEYARAPGGLDWGTWIARVNVGSGCAVPSTPGSVLAAAGDARVALTWAASLGAASYTVKRATTSGGPYQTIVSGLASTTYTDTGLTNGTTYYYVISATNACGESANSAEASATPNAVQVTAAPTKLNAVGAKRKVMLSWTQSVTPGVTQNRIYRATVSGGPYGLIASVGAQTSYTDTQVIGGTIYYYVVTAVSATGESGRSGEASAKPK
jgi:hypothetical protein